MSQTREERERLEQMEIEREGGALAKDLRDSLRAQGFMAWTEVPCVGGPTIGYSAGRMDVWAIKPSYAERYTAAYEIKVRRYDFERDKNTDKFEKYRPYARRFYYACPSGLIKRTEVPEGVGLAVRSKRGWMHLKHPDPNMAYEEIPHEFILMLLRRGLEEEREVRDLEHRVLWDSNHRLGPRALGLGRETAEKLSAYERGGQVEEDTEDSNRRYRALEFYDAVVEMLPKLGLDLDDFFRQDLARQAEFMGQMIGHADLLRRMGAFLQRMPHEAGAEIDKLLRSR